MSATDLKSCNCMEIIENLKQGKCLFIKEKIADNNCCKCCDEIGNNMLHILAKIKMEANDDCTQVLSHILDKPHITEFINKQNNNGETAFLVAVKHENEIGASMLENMGADGSIPDNNGDYVKLDDNNSDNFIGFDATTLNLNAPSMYVNSAMNATKNALESTDVFFENLIKNTGNTLSAPFIPSTHKSTLIAETTSDAIPNNLSVHDNKTTLDTDAMLDRIKQASSKQQSVLTGGGEHKTSFTRKLNVNSDRLHDTNSYYGGRHDDDDDSDDENVGKSELSRLINNRKNELHNEVEARLLEMLSEGLITYKSKPIEANEKNARLIKSFLYNYVRDKNPTLSGMDKITTVKNMPNSEIIELTTDVDLESVEKRNEDFRKKHLEEKAERHQKHAEVNVDSDTTLSLDMESPKKSKAKKADKADKEDKKKKDDKKKKSKK